jgi:tRNA(Arg) A34 adenosine deaminase TadA
MTQTPAGQRYFDLAVAEAEKAAALDEVPVGAAIVAPDGSVLAQAHNLVVIAHDPTGHAEVRAIREAARTWGSERLIGCDLYVTLEPCAMCAAAISFARIRRLYFGAYDPKGGAVENGISFYQSPTCHHAPEVYGGIDEKRCEALLHAYFRQKRKQKTPAQGRG